MNIVFDVDHGMLYLAVEMPNKALCKPDCATTVYVDQNADGAPVSPIILLSSCRQEDGRPRPSSACMDRVSCHTNQHDGCIGHEMSMTTIVLTMCGRLPDCTAAVQNPALRAAK